MPGVARHGCTGLVHSRAGGSVGGDFRYYAGWATKIYGTTNASDAKRFIYMLREPMGVCALINAWNVPLVMAATKIAPAMACGNTAVVKPAERSSCACSRALKGTKTPRVRCVQAAGRQPFRRRT